MTDTPLTPEAPTTERQRIRNLIDQFERGFHTPDEMPGLILATLDAARSALELDEAVCGWQCPFSASGHDDPDVRHAFVDRWQPAPEAGGLERKAAATELLDAAEALLTAEPKSYWLRGPAVHRLRDAYNAVVALAATPTPDPEAVAAHHAWSANCENGNHDDCAGMVECEDEHYGLHDCACPCGHPPQPATPDPVTAPCGDCGPYAPCPKHDGDTVDPAAVAAWLSDDDRLARAIHDSNDHSNRPGCLDMDRDSAAAIIRALTDPTSAEPGPAQSGPEPEQGPSPGSAHPDPVAAALAVARHFDAESFACDFGGRTAINLPNLEQVIPLTTQEVIPHG